MEKSVPKRRHIKFSRRGITQKKTYNIHNTAKVWNQEKYAVNNNFFGGGGVNFDLVPAELFITLIEHITQRNNKIQ